MKDKIKCDNNDMNTNNTNNKIPIVVNCLDILKTKDNNEIKNDIIACSVMGDLNNSVLLLKQDK